MAALTCVSSGKSLAKDLDNFMSAGDDLATLGASVGCFVAGTSIKTEDGEKKIEDIQEGDLVLSYEASEGRYAYKEVLEVVAHEGVTELAHVTIGGETIDSTTNHPYFVVGYGFVEAGNLRTGDTILLANGENRKVDSVEIEFLDDPVTVYNFEVADWHTYFVGNTGVLVHNANIQACGDAAASAGGNGKAADGIGEGGSEGPNPYGKKGGPAHRSVVESIKPKNTGNTIGTEVKFNTDGGYKPYRYADAVEYNKEGEIAAIYQVGKVNKNGTVISRESKAIVDIMSSPKAKGAPIHFLPYNSDIGEIIFDY